MGVNPDPTRYEGILVRHPAAATADLIADAASGRAPVEERTMVEALLDDGQRLVAVNEIFVGHASHQSARYELRIGGRSERQSSSGLIVATGTGQSGWSRSIRTERRSSLPTPGPTDPALTLFVREAWPSVDTGVGLTEALIETVPAETDHLDLPWGAHATVAVSGQRLHLVV